MNSSTLFPPWPTAKDETIVSGGPSFEGCDAVLSDIAASGDGQLSARKYSVSRKWGKIVRASITTEHQGQLFNKYITCWSPKDAGVQISIMGDTFGQ